MKAFSEDLPSGYKNIRLGMSMDDVKSELKKDLNFGYRGERDISLLSGENESIIETDTSKIAPYSFLERCWFQFQDGKLYTITLRLRQNKMDHYSVFSALSKKYGNPTSLNPESSVWMNDSVIMSLERPLTLKYTDKKTLDDMKSKATVSKSGEEVSRDQFLDNL